MRVTDKEVLHRMCDKIKLSDTQKEDIMKKINEEASGKKRRGFNVHRFATIAASILILACTTVFVEAEYGIVGDIADKISNFYKQREGVVLNEAEKAIIDEIALGYDEIGSEFEVDGGTIRIDGIMYDSTYIYLMYTGIANEKYKGIYEPRLGSDLTLIVNGNTWSGGGSTSYVDLDEYEEGFQGYYKFKVNPFQYEYNEATGRMERICDFALSQGDEIALTARRYRTNNKSETIDDYEKIYANFTLSNPVKELVFTCDNTEGMDILETVMEIRITPISVLVIGDLLARKTYPEGIGYKYIERPTGIVIVGSTGDRAVDSSYVKYGIDVVKKDGTVAEFNSGSAGSASGDGYNYCYNHYMFEKPVDLEEVDYILVRGWGLEYKIPVNVE